LIFDRLLDFFKIAYEDKLLFLFNVDQKFEQIDQLSPRKGDSIELFIDTRDSKKAGFITKFCHHFIFFPDDTPPLRASSTTAAAYDPHPAASAVARRDRAILWASATASSSRRSGSGEGQEAHKGSQAEDSYRRTDELGSASSATCSATSGSARAYPSASGAAL